jgi:hypothetical protein
MDTFFELDNDVPATSVQDILAELAGGKRRPKYVYIYTHSVLNIAKSHEAGHRVYDEKPFILVKHRAKDDGVARPVTEEDKKLYAREWKRYQDSVESESEPDVRLLPACTVSLAAELNGMGIKKVSALIARQDELGERFAKVIKQAEQWLAMNEEDEDASDS